MTKGEISGIDYHLLKTTLESTPFPGIREIALPGFRRAAVFLILFSKNSASYFPAILKTNVRGYPWRNQVALPGGHVDPNDKSNLEAAYRELEEELGIARNRVLNVGSLGYHRTIQDVDIEAFVGLWNPEGTLSRDKKEIARVINVNVKDVLAHHKKNNFSGNLPDISRLIYPADDLTIWGATARILRSFLEIFEKVIIR